jgi:hypothetical protein
VLKKRDNGRLGDDGILTKACRFVFAVLSGANGKAEALVVTNQSMLWMIRLNNGPALRNEGALSFAP